MVIPVFSIPGFGYVLIVLLPILYAEIIWDHLIKPWLKGRSK